MADDAPVTVRVLPGLSGARVQLMSKDNRHWFVRKTAAHPDHSARLRRQVAKQIAFASAIGSVVRTPRVLEEGEVDGRYFVDFEFVRGADGVTYLRRANNNELAMLTDRLCEYLRLAARLPATMPVAGTLFDGMYTKLCDVQRKTSALDSSTLTRMFTALDSVRAASSTLTPTLCHGDLTLENLIVDDNHDIWVLDLLDAPFEHYWQDVAKLHQDLEGGWYLLGQQRIARYVLEYVSRRLMVTATELDPGYPSVHAILLACTFSRILPYARSEREEQFVKQRVEHFARLAHGDV